MDKQLIRAVLLIALPLLGSAQILTPILQGGATPFTFTATTTTPSESVQIDRLTTATDAFLYWGDGTSTLLVAGTTTARTHTYATAGTHQVRLADARIIQQIDMRNAKLGSLNTAQLRGAVLTYWYCTAITGSTIRSADMVAWRPTTWQLSSMPAGGTYAIASADMVAWRPTTGNCSPCPLGHLHHRQC